MREFCREDSGFIEVTGTNIVEKRQKTQRRSDKYWTEKYQNRFLSLKIMKGKSIQLQQQDLKSRSDKPTKGSKRFEDSNQTDLKEVKKNRSKSRDPPNSTNSSEMKTKKGEKDDVKSRGKENAKEAKDNKTNNKDKKTIGKQNIPTKDKQTTNKESPKKGQQAKDEKSKHQFKQEKDNHKQVKGRREYSKDDMEIEKNKKQKRKEDNARVNKSIQTDKSALKSSDDHSVQYGGKHGGQFGYPSSYGESSDYDHRKSDAYSENDHFRNSTSYNSSVGDGSLRRGFRHHFSSQKYFASVAEKPAPPQKPSSKPKARFGLIDSEDNPRTSQSRGKGNNFEEEEDRYDGPEYIRSRFSAKSGTRNHTTLSMYSVKSSRVLDDEEDLDRCSSNLSGRGNENGIDRPTDELIDLEDSLDNRPRHSLQNGEVVENGEVNGDRTIIEYEDNNFENSGSHRVDILKITTPGDSSGKEDTGELSNGRNFQEEENIDQSEDVLERRLQALRSNGSHLLRAGSPEGNVRERRRSERFPDNTNLLANHKDNEKTEEETERIEGEGSPQRVASSTNNQDSVINGDTKSQHSARAKKSEGSPQMSARTQRNGESPERNSNERRRSQRFPDNENMLEKKKERETKVPISVKKSTSIRRSQRFPSKDEALPSTDKSSTEQRKLKQSNSFRGRSRNPVRRFKASKIPQQINAGGNGKQTRTFQKGPQSLDRNIPSRQSKEATGENRSQSPVTGSFPPRPPSRPRSHDGRYSVDSLYLPDDHKQPEVDNTQQQPNNHDDIREDSLERPLLVARDSLKIIRHDKDNERTGNDKDGKESEEETNQYGYSGYGYTTSQDSPQQRNGEMLEQSADELKTTVEELEKRFDAIENEDEENEYASGNEWKTRFETQTEMNQQLERQILMLENKVEESKKNLKDAGKTPQEGQLFIDLADANPQLVKQLEKEKLGLINSIRDLEWRLDQESKAYHRANDERKQYVIEIQSTKGNIYQVQKQRAAAGDATYRTPRVDNGGNIPDDQRILDPKKGPIRKTAGVKTLPSLDSV